MADDEQRLTEGDERNSNGFYDTSVLPFLAELVGVCSYAMIAVLTCLNNTSCAVLTCFNNTPYGEGIAIAVFMVSFAGISGGHLNPAVTLGATIAGRINKTLAFFYFIAQTLGGMLGAAFARAVIQNEAFSNINGCITLVNQEVGVGWRILGEGLLTCVWVFIYLMTVTNGNANGKKVGPFAVGLYVIVARMASLQTTGGSMNPALSFGKSVAASALTDGAWTDHYVFWVGPLAGALVSSICYKLFFAPRDRRWFF